MRRAFFLAFSLVLIGLPDRASAQGPDAPPAVIDAPADVSACLCLEQSVAAEMTEMKARRADYDLALHDLTDLNSQVEHERPEVDVHNQERIEAFKALLDRHDVAQERFQSVVLPDYQQAVERYNRIAMAISHRCGGRPLDPVAVEAAKRQLICTPD